MFVKKMSFRMISDPKSEKLVKYKVWVKLSCGKVMVVKRVDVFVALWYMAGTWLSNAQGVLYRRMIKHRKKCKKCRKVVIKEWYDKPLVRI